MRGKEGNNQGRKNRALDSMEDSASLESGPP